MQEQPNQNNKRVIKIIKSLLLFILGVTAASSHMMGVIGLGLFLVFLIMDL